MPDIKDILRNEDFGSIVGDLCVDTRENRNPREYMGVPSILNSKM